MEVKLVDVDRGRIVVADFRIFLQLQMNKRKRKKKRMIITYIYNCVTYNKATTIHKIIKSRDERKQNHCFICPLAVID
jgi:hypothetical protein